MKPHSLNIRKLLETAPPVLDFVLPGLLAGSVGTVVGSGGVGKTTFLLQVAMDKSANTSNASDIFPNAETPGRVVFIAAEESAEILSVRLHAIWGKSGTGEPPSVEAAIASESEIALMEANLHIVPLGGHDVLLVKDGCPTEFFEQLCEFCKGARLVIIDPLRRLHDGDENSSAAMTQVVQVLESLAKRTGAAVIATHHMNKTAGFTEKTDSASASRGSSALTDAVRWQINLSNISENDAKAYCFTDERRSCLRLDFAKTNYAAPLPHIWMKREDGGALTRFEPQKSPRTTSSGKNRSKSGAKRDGELIYV